MPKMSNLFKIFFLLSFTFSLFGCYTNKNKQPDSNLKNLTIEEQNIPEVVFERKIFGDQFILYIPKYLSEAADLNQAASAQYANLEKDIYFITIVGDKSGMEKPRKLMDFYESLNNNFITKKAKPIPDPYAIEVNGLDGIQWQAVGEYEGKNVLYFMTVLESKSNFYQIVSWMYESDKDLYLEDMQTIIKSFAELSKKPN